MLIMLVLEITQKVFHLVAVLINNRNIQYVLNTLTIKIRTFIIYIFAQEDVFYLKLIHSVEWLDNELF